MKRKPLDDVSDKWLMENPDYTCGCGLNVWTGLHIPDCAFAHPRIAATPAPGHPHDGYAYDGCKCVCCLNVRALAATAAPEPLDRERLAALVEAISHPCHDACVGQNHADCQCAAFIRESVIDIIREEGPVTSPDPHPPEPRAAGRGAAGRTARRAMSTARDRKRRVHALLSRWETIRFANSEKECVEDFAAMIVELEDRLAATPAPLALRIDNANALGYREGYRAAEARHAALDAIEEARNE